MIINYSIVFNIYFIKYNWKNLYESIISKKMDNNVSSSKYNETKIRRKFYTKGTEINYI